MALDDLDDQVGEALAGIADHLDRVALAGEFDFGACTSVSSVMAAADS